MLTLMSPSSSLLWFFVHTYILFVFFLLPFLACPPVAPLCAMSEAVSYFRGQFRGHNQVTMGFPSLFTFKATSPFFLKGPVCRI